MVQIDIVEVVLRQKRAPEEVIRLIRAMYTDAEIHLATPFGMANPFCRNRGVHQGSALSYMLCLLCLEPHHRAMEALPSNTLYRMAPGIHAQMRAYCDDFSDYPASLDTARTRCRLGSRILAACGIGTDAGKTLILGTNLAPSPTLPMIEFETYNRDTGLKESFTLPVRSMTDPVHNKYKLLGSHFSGALINFDASKKLVASLRATLTRISCLRLTPAPATIPRAIAFAAALVLGLSLPSAGSSSLIAVQRELLITLCREDYEGKLARISYNDIRTSLSSLPNSLIYRCVTKLARFGIFVHSADELLLARSLSFLRSRLPVPSTLPNLAARQDECLASCTANANFSVFSKLATRLRLQISNDAPGQKAPSLREAIAQARLAAARDWQSTCTTYGLPDPTDCPTEENAFDPICPTADARFQLLFRQHSTESRAFLDRWGPAPKLNSMAATDGGDLGAACIVTLPPDTSGSPVSPLDCPLRPTVIYIKRHTESAKHGNNPTSCFETEMRGTLSDLHLRQFVALGPSVLDNQSVMDFVSAPLALDIRTLITHGRASLLRPLRAAKRIVANTDLLNVEDLLDRASANCDLANKFYHDLQPHQRPARNPVQVFSPRSELHCYVKIKSHQPSLLPPEGPSPCFQMYFANQAADKEATAGTKDANLHPVPLITVPPFRGPFLIMHKEVMICNKLSRYIKQQLCHDSLAQLRDVRARKSFALIPLCSEHIHPAAMNILTFPDVTAPILSEQVTPESTSVSGYFTTTHAMLFAHALQLGPSWHNILREYRSAVTFPPDTEELNLSATPLADCCPLCLPRRVLSNAYHYRTLNCSSPAVQEAVHRVYSQTEDCLQDIAPVKL